MTQSPPQSTERFLLVRLSSLGDLVHTLPVIPALRSSFPNARIDWLVDRRWFPLIKLVDGIDEVIPLDRSFSGYLACARRLRQAHYSCAVDFQGLYRSAVLVRLSGVEHRIGRDRSAAREPGAARFYTDRVIPTGQHVADMNSSLAMRAGAVPQAEMQFPLHVPQNEAQRVRERLREKGIDAYVVVSPGGGWKSKCWPPDRYGTLCSALWRRHGVHAVINVGPGEEDLGASVVRASTPAKPLALRPQLAELPALLAGARLVIGGDTGPLHLAAALGSRVVALFGPTDPARNRPLPGGTVLRNLSSDTIAYERGDYNRADDYSPAILSLSIDQVLTAVELELTVEHGTRS